MPIDDKLVVVGPADEPSNALIHRAPRPIESRFEDASTFTGHVVMTLDHAMELVEEFAHSGSVGDHARTCMS